MSEEKARLKFITVPFKADSPNGMMAYRGIAKFSFAGIVIEYESKILDLVGGVGDLLHPTAVEAAAVEDLDARVEEFFAHIRFRHRADMTSRLVAVKRRRGSPRSADEAFTR